MSNFVKNHPRLALVLVNLGLFITLAVATELILRMFFPYKIATVGNLESTNAALYGWGYNPHELITVTDPDTGATYRASTNGNGWRDRDHEFAKPNGTFRILVLGDSVTFGGAVPLEKIYTRLLEDILVASGFETEVISIGYGGWGTDHELEVLKREGLRYKPDLVIFQWDTNDLTDIFSHGGTELGTMKPFYYELDSAGLLVRKTSHRAEVRLSGKDRLKIVVSKSEILKRLFGVYQNFRGFRMRGVPYEITAEKLEQLRTVLGDTQLSDILKNELGKKVERDNLCKVIDSCGLSQKRDFILRILEKRWFDKYWSKKDYFPMPASPDSKEWKLYFAIMLEARRLADENKFDIAIFSDQEDGLYQWSVYRGHISPDPKYRQYFLSPNDILKGFASSNGMGYVDHRFQHLRTMSDPHSNAAGNYAMAMNLYQFILNNYGGTLKAGRANMPHRPVANVNARPVLQEH